jgi:hypothetical protein
MLASSWTGIPVVPVGLVSSRTPPKKEPRTRSNNSTVRRSTGAAYGSIVHRRKSARPDQVDHDRTAAVQAVGVQAAVQAVGVQAAVETSVVGATQGLLLEHLRLRANVTAEARRVDDHLAVLGQVRLLGEMTTGVVASATVVNADAPRAKRARVAVAVAVVVVAGAPAKIMTRSRRLAARSTTSTTGIDDWD